jgi:hypothetical protein
VPSPPSSLWYSDGVLPDHQWQALADVAEALCLTEIVRDDAPAADDDDLHAAYLVRRRTTSN